MKIFLKPIYSQKVNAKSLLTSFHCQVVFKQLWTLTIMFTKLRDLQNKQNNLQLINKISIFDSGTLKLDDMANNQIFRANAMISLQLNL